MKITKTFIDGLFQVDLKNFEDLRGQLLKPFSQGLYQKEISLNLDFKETWFTRSNLNVIRAMHLQVAPRACEKLVAIIQGSVLDVILDLRPESETFGKTFSIVLSADDPKALYIPQGCAHGYKVLKDQSIVMYMATDLYAADLDVGIKWDSFGFNWDIKNPILSVKDQTLPSFQEFKNSYRSESKELL